MLMWAEDKISREVPGLNMLTVRMLLRAEQRTVSAVLHARSATQTREVVNAAYRRAGLCMDNMATQAQENDRVTLDMTTALAQQTYITGQIAGRLNEVPTNQDFIRLLEATQQQSRANDIIVDQIARIMTCLLALRERLVPEEQAAPTDTQPYEEGDQQHAHSPQPRVWEPFGEAWERAPPTPLGSSPRRDEDVMDVQEQDTVVGDMSLETTPSPELEPSPEAQTLPTPRREPLAFAPGGYVADPIQAVRQASQRNQRRGTATRPFRASR